MRGDWKDQQRILWHQREIRQQIEKEHTAARLHPPSKRGFKMPGWILRFALPITQASELKTVR